MLRALRNQSLALLQAAIWWPAGIEILEYCCPGKLLQGLVGQSVKGLKNQTLALVQAAIWRLAGIEILEYSCPGRLLQGLAGQSAKGLKKPSPGQASAFR